MRFGIMALQRRSLVPEGLSMEGLYQHLTAFDHPAVVRRLAAAGFSLIELGGDLELFFPQAFAEPTIEALGRLKEELGLNYTVHLPLWSVEPSSPLEHVRRGSVQVLVDHIRATLPLEPEVYVLHATGALAAEFYRMGLPEMAQSVVLRQLQAKAQQSLQEVLAETGIAPRRLAIETVEFPFELTLELAEALDLSICLDTGHVIVGFSGPVTVEEALERSLPRLAEVHLHDGPWQGPEGKIGYGQDHRPLGEGDLDVARLLGRLEQADFQGPIIFELQLEEALRSLELIGTLQA